MRQWRDRPPTRYYQLLGDFRLADRHREAIQRVTPDEIMEVARKYFHPANLSLVGYVPVVRL